MNTITIEEIGSFIEDVLYEDGEVTYREDNIGIKFNRSTQEDYFDDKQEDEDLLIERRVEKIIDELREEFDLDFDYELIRANNYIVNISVV